VDNFTGGTTIVGYSMMTEVDISDASSFCLQILSAIDLQRHVFPFEKLLLNVRLCL